MGILIWIVFGIVSGAVARQVMPGPDPLGLVGSILLGLGGGLLGGTIGMLTTGTVVPGLDVRSLLMAIAGSLLTLLLYRSYAMRWPA
ncbi:MAG: GlsB/YeaQ/YmgE family stress response membrane protein [Pirellulaceae bacterium]|nr:GlsB/YeaQ/YmgE family stress response membrane protein [Pirellulaceae bacterium]